METVYLIEMSNGEYAILDYDMDEFYTAILTTKYIHLATMMGELCDVLGYINDIRNNPSNYRLRTSSTVEKIREVELKIV